jgi:hypothetical protein
VKAKPAAKSFFHSFGVLTGFFSLLALLFLRIWSYLPMQDPPGYFDFADQRPFWGVPFFYNVVSNAVFMYAAIYGFSIFVKCSSRANTAFWRPYLLMTAGVLFTAIGSSFFHLNNSPETLMWDRLPMAITFASLVVLIFTDRVSAVGTRFYLIALNAAALWTVWNISYGDGDLRPYIVTQFGSIAAIGLFMFFKNGIIERKYILIAFGFYAAAKVCELQDAAIMSAFQDVSGHTLKHLLAGVGVIALYFGIRRGLRRD